MVDKPIIAIKDELKIICLVAKKILEQLQVSNDRVVVQMLSCFEETQEGHEWRPYTLSAPDFPQHYGSSTIFLVLHA